MTIKEAIRILDPESSKEALLPYAYDSHQRRKVVDEACRVAVDELRKRQWISVEARLPENGEYVLCWYEYFRYGNYNRLFQTYGIGYQFNGHWSGEVAQGRQARVIAWQPLPEPPKEREENA